MITLTIDDKSALGQQITHRAHAAGVSPIALIHGIAYDAFNALQGSASIMQAPAESTPAPAPAAPAAAPAAPVHKPAPTAGMFDSMPA